MFGKVGNLVMHLRPLKEDLKSTLNDENDIFRKFGS